jgi:hypothetical protein
MSELLHLVKSSLNGDIDYAPEKKSWKNLIRKYAARAGPPLLPSSRPSTAAAGFFCGSLFYN